MILHTLLDYTMLNINSRKIKAIRDFAYTQIIFCFWKSCSDWHLNEKIRCTSVTLLYSTLFLFFFHAVISTSTQQTNELPCDGSTALKYPLLQAFLPVLCIQCSRWPWQWRLSQFQSFSFNFYLFALNSHSIFFHCSGKGCVFTYDAVGSYERVGYSAQGSGSTLIMPVLDNQLKSPSPLLLPARVCTIISLPNSINFKC